MLKILIITVSGLIKWNESKHNKLVKENENAIMVKETTMKE